MQAAYPMYNQPETQHWVDQWWQAISTELQQRGINAPAELTQPADYYAHWQADDLLLSQTCGYPLTHDLAGKVQYLMTPCYDTPYNEGANYCSLVLVHEDSQAETFEDLKGQRFAFNSVDSQSGYNCLRFRLAEQGVGEQGHADYFGDMLVSGGHRQSLAMVQTGQADLCACDSVTFALLAKHAPEHVASLKVVATTRQMPGLPLITSSHTSAATAEQLRVAVRTVQADPAVQECLSNMLIKDWQVLPLSAYDVLK